MAHSDPLVSIVIPTFNHVRFIKRSVQSLLDQTYNNIEIIIVNDGSTDGTRPLLDNIKEIHPSKIQVIHQENKGQSAALNLGWGISKGEYLSYLSSDDVLYPRAVEIVIRHLQDNPRTIATYPNSDLIDRRDLIIKPSVCREFEFTDCIVEQTCNIGPGAIFRRQAFEHTGGWRNDLKLGPDRYFWIGASQLGKIDFINQVHAGYRFHPDAISYKEQSEYVSREYVRVTRQVYREQTDQVLGKAAGRRDQAMATAYLIVSRNRLRSSELRRAYIYYKLACKYNHAFKSTGTKIKLIKSAYSKFIRIMFVNNAIALFYKIRSKVA